IIQTVMKLLQGDWEGAWNTIKSTAVKIVGNIVKFFKDVDLLQIGKDILQGLINGFTSMVDAVTSTVKNIAGNIKNAITDFFDIHSPSRVMAEVGKWISQGLAVGIESQESQVTKTMLDLGYAIMDVTDHYKSEEAKIIKTSNAE